MQKIYITIIIILQDKPNAVIMVQPNKKDGSFCNRIKVKHGHDGKIKVILIMIEYQQDIEQGTIL